MSTIIKVSDFLKNDISPFILGAFYSRPIVDKEHIFAISTYNKSSKIKPESINETIYENSKTDYLGKLNFKSDKSVFWYQPKIRKDLPKPSRRAMYCLALVNDLKISHESFFNQLYRKVISQCDWIFDKSLNESKRDFISGFMECRGSIDTNRPYISQDYFFENKFESKKMMTLESHCNVPIDKLNINFRNLQPQFVTGTNMRNTQFRIDLNWYLKEIGVINIYKAAIFEHNYSFQSKEIKGQKIYYTNEIRKGKYSDQIIKRLDWFNSTVLGKELTGKEIKNQRISLGFDGVEKFSRDQQIIKLIKLKTADVCDSCKDLFDIKNRSFKTPEERYYFEIHHVISLGGNKQLDDINNLSKLCPTCHVSLRKGRAKPAVQKKTIDRILDNNARSLEFCSSFFNTNNRSKLVDEVYNSLR